MSIITFKYVIVYLLIGIGINWMLTFELVGDGHRWITVHEYR